MQPFSNHKKDRFPAIVLLMFLVVPLALSRQQTLVVTLFSPIGGKEYLNGYEKTISGAVIDYRSSHPDAQSALLVRARKEVRSAVWQTESLRPPKDGVYHLVWLAGLEREGFKDDPESYPFDLRVNGTRWFTFRNRKDGTAWRWEETAPNGARLAFHASMADRAGDLSGMMYLDIPLSAAPPGEPLRLEVTGADSGSEDWYMTFQYSFRFFPSVRIEPVLLRDPSLNRLARLSIDNLVDSARAEVSLPGGRLKRIALNIGSNIVRVPFQGTPGSGNLALLVREGSKADSSIVRIPPVTQRDIYLLPYSHHDIGYTDIQPAVEKRHWRNIDDALRLIRETKDLPDGARFKWNVEVLWAFDSYLRNASDLQRQQVLAAIRDGSLGLNAFYGNMQTGIMSSEELTRSIAFAKEFSGRYGIPIQTALQSDVPGFVWGVVPALARQGVRYFASSPNSSDRIGYVLATWGDRPFYWMSQSGRDSVLFWVAGLSYASFHEGSLPRLGEDKLVGILRKLDSEHYPYRIVNLPYTLGDNAGVDTALPDYVRKWNERYESPRLVIATYRDLFTAFEREYGAGLPRHAGDFTPYWEDGTISTASETALNRRSANRLLQAAVLCAMNPSHRIRPDEFSKAWRNVVLFDEHTWGAWNSISDPDNPGVKAQWTLKRQFALDGDSLSRSLLSRALADRPGRTEVFDVVNTCSWTRSDLITIPQSRSRRGNKVTDAEGKPLASQRLLNGDLAVLVTDVPGFGAKRIFIQRGESPVKGNAWAKGTLMGNEKIRVEVDPHEGTLRSVSSIVPGKGVVDLGHDLDRYFYAVGASGDTLETLSNVRVSIGEKGPLVSDMIVRADAPGCSSYTTLIRIVSGLDRIELTHHLAKNAVRTKESIHVEFPFSFPGGTRRYDVANSIVVPGIDQLEGSNKNFFSVQRWIDVSDSSSGITLTVPDTPLAEFAEITAEKPWRTTVAAGTTVISYVMNNYWHTNFKADQEGEFTMRYRLIAHGAFDETSAAKRGLESGQPFLVVGTTARSPLPKLPISVKTDRSVVTSLTSGTNEWQLTLYNPAPVNDPVLITRKSQSGTRQAKEQTVVMGPFETRELRIKH